MNISTVLTQQTQLHSSAPKASAPQQAAEAKSNPTEDKVSLGSKRINWPDVKELGALALSGGAMGAMPVIGASIGAFEVSMNSIFSDGLEGSGRGLLQMASNIAGTASLAMGFLPGAVLGLGASALIGGGAFVQDNMMGKELMTSAPLPASAPPETEQNEAPTEKKPEFSAARLAKAAGAGALATAFGATPGLGLLLGLNAGDSMSEDRGALQTLSGITTLTRLGGAVASVLTLNPAPYVAAVAVNALVLGVDNAVMTYEEG